MFRLTKRLKYIAPLRKSEQKRGQHQQKRREGGKGGGVCVWGGGGGREEKSDSKTHVSVLTKPHPQPDLHSAKHTVQKYSTKGAPQVPA